MLLVALEQFGKLHLSFLIILGGQHHPKILNRRRHQAVIEIDQGKVLIPPRILPKMTVTVSHADQ